MKKHQRTLGENPTLSNVSKMLAPYNPTHGLSNNFQFCFHRKFDIGKIGYVFFDKWKFGKVSIKRKLVSIG